MARAGELGPDQALTFLREVDAIHGRQRARMVDFAREQCGGTLRGRRLAVLGAAFKPDSDDVRDSPALDVAVAAQHAGATVTVHDPRALPTARAARPELRYAQTVAEAVEGAHVTLHLTEWQHYRELDPVAIGPLVSERQIIDGRNALDPSRWQSAGWIYRALGRPAI
jgi:UDPglucose 6-dehydrogenase